MISHGAAGGVKPLKDGIGEGVTIGSWITVGSTAVAEIMARSGFDWLTVDMEHSSITLDIAQEMVRVIDLCGVPAMVRVGVNDPNMIKRAMDTGLQGVIVPMVNSAEEAERAVSAAMYPPRGTRGVGLARAQAYGMGFEEYRKWLGEKGVVIVQVEHIKAVENLEAILSVPGVDGFIVGPYDLSGSLGVPGRFDHPDVVSALEEVQRVTKRLGALSGFHVIPPDPEKVREKVDAGYRFIAYSLDSLMLAGICRTGVAEVRSLIQEAR